MKWHRIVLLVAVIVLIVVAVIGYFNSPANCANIGDDCRACWSRTETYGRSEYCPTNQSCKIEPYIDQHNALIDVLNCACAKASSNQYTDAQLNNDIIRFYNTITGVSGTTQDACNEMNPMLVKWSYG